MNVNCQVPVKALFGVVLQLYDNDIEAVRDELTDETVTISLFDKSIFWESSPLGIPSLLLKLLYSSPSVSFLAQLLHRCLITL